MATKTSPKKASKKTQSRRPVRVRAAWKRRKCPTCEAAKGEGCVSIQGSNVGAARKPHDRRIPA